MQTLSNKQPKFWDTEGANTSNYVMLLDDRTQHNGKTSVLIRSQTAGKEDYYRLFQVVNLDDWRGQRLRVSGYFKTEGVVSHAVISVTVQTQGGETLVYDAMIDRSLRGDNDWQRLETVFDVPESSRFVYFGPTLWGPGKMWAADFQVEIVSTDVPRTDIHGDKAVQQATPINLDFRDGVKVTTVGNYFEAPTGWRQSHMPKNAYLVGLEPNCYNGKSAATITALESTAPTKRAEPNCGTLTQHFSAVPYRGKKVKLRAMVRCENANDACGLIMMVHGPFSKWWTLATLQEGSVSGTSDWTELVRVLPVAEQAYTISIWLQLNGGGKAYFADVQFSEAEPDDEITHRGSGPQNLDFSET